MTYNVLSGTLNLLLVWKWHSSSRADPAGIAVGGASPPFLPFPSLLLLPFPPPPPSFSLPFLSLPSLFSPLPSPPLEVGPLKSS